MLRAILALTVFSVIFLASSPLSVAHEKHKHPGPDKADESTAKAENESDTPEQKIILEQIGSDYERSVRPIFEQKCLNCHGGPTQYPWYYKFPGAKGLIDSDIAEAKKHLDISKGFPFTGHGSPKDDLEAIGKTTRELTMPPFRYWIMYWGARLTGEDQKTILDWVERSLERLETVEK